MSAPIASPSANVSFKTKMDVLWQTNKPLFIALVALVTLIVFAIIFCIVYFLVIRPRMADSSSTTPTPTAAKTAHLMYQSLRTFAHI